MCLTRLLIHDRRVNRRKEVNFGLRPLSPTLHEVLSHLLHPRELLGIVLLELLHAGTNLGPVRTVPPIALATLVTTFTLDLLLLGRLRRTGLGQLLLQ